MSLPVYKQHKRASVDSYGYRGEASAKRKRSNSATLSTRPARVRKPTQKLVESLASASNTCQQQAKASQIVDDCTKRSEQLYLMHKSNSKIIKISIKHENTFMKKEMIHEEQRDVLSYVTGTLLN